MILTKEQILTASDVETTEVDVPEWGGKVLVAMMTGTGRDVYEESLFVTNKDGDRVRDLTNIRAKLVASCVVDEKGNLLFSSDDVAALGKKSADALDRVFDHISSFNALADAGVEEQAKNS